MNKILKIAIPILFITGFSLACMDKDLSECIWVLIAFLWFLRANK